YRRSAGLAAFALVPVLLAYCYSCVHHSILIDRSFIAGTVVFPLLLVLPLTWIRHRVGRWTIFAVAPVLIVPGILSIRPQQLARPIEDWSAICRDIQLHRGGRQLVVFIGNEGELLYDFYVRGGDYSPQHNLTGAPADLLSSNPPRTLETVRSADDLNQLRAALGAGDYDQIVLVSTHSWFTDKGSLAREFLHQTRAPIGAVAFDDIRIHRWGGAGVRLPTLEAEPIVGLDRNR